MKEKTKKILSCVIFFLCLAIAIHFCAGILEYKEGRKKYDAYYNSSTDFDVIFLGSSHMYNHVLPMELWKEYGISSYNWGYANCTPAINYYLVQDILKQSHPKVIVMDAYGLYEYEGYNNKKYKTDFTLEQHVQFDTLKLSQNKIQAVNDIFDDYPGRRDFLWNFITYHNRWEELTANDFHPSISTEKGAHFVTGLGKGEFVEIPEEEKTTLEESVCLDYFEKLVQYCASKDTEVLLVYTPYPTWDVTQRIANSLNDNTDKYPSCSYLNGFHSNILNYDTDIYLDDHHLNYSGSVKVTSWLGAYLKEHYSLEDYRENLDWQKDYEAYLGYKKDNLNLQYKLVNYLTLLNDDDFRVEVILTEEELLENEVLKELLENANVTITIEPQEGHGLILKIYESSTNQLWKSISFLYEEEIEDISSIDITNWN